VIELDTARLRLSLHGAIAASIRSRFGLEMTRQGYRPFPQYWMTRMERRVKAPDTDIHVLRLDGKRGEAVIQWCDERDLIKQAIAPQIAMVRRARRAGIRASRA
jgi:hypothetical protein